MHIQFYQGYTKRQYAPSIEWLIWCIDNINGEPFVLLTHSACQFEPMPADIPCIRGLKTGKNVNAFMVARLDWSTSLSKRDY